MIPGDLGAELAAAIGELVATGHLPGSALGLNAAGTWRPVPGTAAPAAAAPAAFAPDGAAGDAAAGEAAPDPAASDDVAGRAAARYATSLPFELARRSGQEPKAVAARLGRVIERAGWIVSAEPTGAGYLTIGVTAAALAAVAIRTSKLGPACARSDALQSISRPVPPLPELTAALSWRQAWHDQAAALAGRLAEAAGAIAAPPDRGPLIIGRPARHPTAADAPARTPAAGSTVADTVDFVGADAVRYWLARLPAARAGILDRAVFVTPSPVPPRTRPPGAGAPDARAPGARAPGALKPGARAADARGTDARGPDARAPERPSYSPPPYSAPSYLSRDLGAVRLAAADAAATGRWAAELGLARLEPPLAAGRLGQPAEIALLIELSWLAERVAGAARRRQPDELPRYLERLAGAWRDCRESCPALPFGGRAAPGDAAGTSARLWLADATATALAAGLDLVGVRSF